MSNQISLEWFPLSSGMVRKQQKITQWTNAHQSVLAKGKKKTKKNQKLYKITRCGATGRYGSDTYSTSGRTGRDSHPSLHRPRGRPVGVRTLADGVVVLPGSHGHAQVAHAHAHGTGARDGGHGGRGDVDLLLWSGGRGHAGAVPLRLLQLVVNLLEGRVDPAERRPVARVEAPALEHQVVDGRGAVLRAPQHVALLDVLDHLLVGHPVVGLQGVRENLPQTHPVAPHVWLQCEFVGQYALRRHPPRKYISY